jgi:hypothetical protein
VNEYNLKLQINNMVLRRCSIFMSVRRRAGLMAIPNSPEQLAGSVVSTRYNSGALILVIPVQVSLAL